MSEYIYYIVTSPSTVKFGGTSNINNRQKAHYTSSPFLEMHPYKVNDAYKAEQELHRLARPYKLNKGDIIGGTIINNNAQLNEHYKLTEQDAIYFCEMVQKKFCENKPLDNNRTYCNVCHHVINVSTKNNIDGYRCKRCLNKLLKKKYMTKIIKKNSKLKYTKDELEEMYYYYKNDDSYDYNDDFIDDESNYKLWDGIYEIEKILGHCINNGIIYYKLKYKNSDKIKWILLDDLEKDQNNLNIIREYQKQLLCSS